MHKHGYMNGTLQIIKKLCNRQLEPKNLSTRKDPQKNLNQSFISQVKKEKNKKVTQFMMNFNKH